MKDKPKKSEQLYKTTKLNVNDSVIMPDGTVVGIESAGVYTMPVDAVVLATGQ